MIQSEPPITSMTINTPNASARMLLVLSAPVVMCREEHQVHAHLRDRQHHRRDRNARLPDEIGARDKE
jgi:hypothetical protein